METNETKGIAINKEFDELFEEGEDKRIRKIAPPIDTALGSYADGIDEPLLPGAKMMMLYEAGKTDGEIAAEALGHNRKVNTVAGWRK